MDNIVITIGREYGSGGKYIGEEVAKRLGIAFYDKELLQKVYEESGINYATLEEFDEKTKSTFANLFKLSNNDLLFTEENCRLIMKKAIKKIAESESCVFIGRDTNQILKEQKNALHFFIYANDEEFKIARKMKIENLSYEEAKSKMIKVDNERKKFYETINKNTKWGNMKDYDYCLDSSKLGVEKTIALILDIVKSFKEKE